MSRSIWLHLGVPIGTSSRTQISLREYAYPRRFLRIFEVTSRPPQMAAIAALKVSDDAKDAKEAPKAKANGKGKKKETFIEHLRRKRRPPRTRSLKRGIEGARTALLYAAVWCVTDARGRALRRGI